MFRSQWTYTNVSGAANAMQEIRGGEGMGGEGRKGKGGKGRGGERRNVSPQCVAQIDAYGNNKTLVKRITHYVLLKSSDVYRRHMILSIIFIYTYLNCDVGWRYKIQLEIMSIRYYNIAESQVGIAELECNFFFSKTN